MRVDLGFWNQQGEYIQDIQEINKMDMDKYFEELNDMANFKGFGEVKAKEYDITDYLKDDKELQKEVIKNFLDEIVELKAENERLKSQIKDLQIRKDRYYLKGLEQERQISDYITLLQEIKEIAETAINGMYATKSSDYSEGMETIGHYVMNKISEVME